MVGQKKEPLQYTKAKKIFEKIENNVYSVVLSRLVFMELKSALRLDSSRNKYINGMETDKKIENIDENTNTRYSDIVKEITSLNNVSVGSDRIINQFEFLKTSASLLQDVKGTFKKDKYKFAGVNDIFHILIAKKLGCNKLLTFDQGFEEMNGHKLVNPLEIKVI